MKIINKIPAVTLTEVVNTLMLHSFNDRRKYFLNYLGVAKWAWKDLLKDTMWSIVSVYVKVDKTTTPYSIDQPTDMIRFLNVSEADDCNNLQPYSIDEYMNTLQKPKVKSKCRCHKDNGCEDALCDAIDSITIVTKEHIIGEETYTEKIWTKRCDNGDIIEIREVPVKDYTDAENYTVKTDIQERLICSLDVNAAGCVLPSKENVKLLIENCGCFLNTCIAGECTTDLKKTHNDFGTAKLEDGKIFLKTKSDWVILSYQTNGDCNGDLILVPEVAVDALLFGIDYRTKAFRPNVQRYEKTESYTAYRRAKGELQRFLNPIRIDEFIRIGWQLPKWGGRNTVIKNS